MADPIRIEVESQDKMPSTTEWKMTGGPPLPILVPATVYPPREDSELLDIALANLGEGNGRKFLEIGCGSGVISIAAAKRGWDVSACDINPFAVAATKGNATRNNAQVSTIEGGLTSELVFTNSATIESQGPFDVIVWNLPYLSPVNLDEPRLGPFEDAGLVDTPENNGWGVALLNHLEQNQKLLSPGGSIYLVHTNNERGNLLQSRWRKYGWATRIAGELRFNDGERITCFCAWKPFSHKSIEWHNKLDSTNLFLFENERDVGTLIACKNQKKGRGQREREWIQQPGDFAGSWLLDPNLIAEGVGKIQLFAGIAVIDTICSLARLPLASNHWTNCNPIGNNSISMKWPNDVLFNGKKLAGCLMEGRQTGDKQKVVLGIGVNLTPLNSDTIPSAGLSEIIHDVDLDEFSNNLNGSISSFFEEGELLPKRQDYDQVSWALLGNFLDQGISLQNEKEKLRVTKITHTGELICTNEMSDKIIAESYGNAWN
ncbi:MAG: biotin--[acetyl-CoA-carboxylase] ligase [Euryarchaeota archaeon]|jgi:biotin-[acetyl-CoA-carboxylase] ligase BirA-like protein|nr:biotin--[acetyl-CoA-carboxylase] ligase [Euryarchaeota archaeon]